MLAFVWSNKTGIIIHENIKKIEIKKQGRKANSIFKYELSLITGAQLNFKNRTDIDEFKFCHVLNKGLINRDYNFFRPVRPKHQVLLDVCRFGRAGNKHSESSSFFV